MANSPILSDSTSVTTSDDTTLAVRDRATMLAENPQLANQTLALEVLQQKAKLLLASGLLPDAIDSWQKAAVIMMRAEELNVDYWVGLIHLNAIKGAPMPDGQLCMALIQRSGWMERYEILETTDERCVIRMKRYGQPAFDVTCTFKEYEKVGGPDKAKQPKTHLFWYTYKQGARRLFSDVLNNMHQRRYQGPQIIVEDDLPTDLPNDDVFIVEEGEDKPTATTPLSPAPSAPLALPAENASKVADGGSDVTEAVFTENAQGAEVLISADGEIIARGNASVELGSLNLTSLQERAKRAGLVDNDFHFAALLRQMLSDGTIREGTTADKILDLMREHKANKEFEALGGGK